jgi:hypothetical protein
MQQLAAEPDQARTLLAVPPSGRSRWSVGTPVTVQVTGKHLVAQPASQSFTWSGERNLLSFLISIDADAPQTTTHLCFEAFIGPVAVAFIPVPIAISMERREPQPKMIQSAPFSTAFASYASADAAQVALGLSWLKRWDSGLDVFLDCLDLKANEQWKRELEAIIPNKDVFLLFWSVNAMKSPWVQWELQTACRVKDRHAIRPMPLDDPEIAPPPDALKDLQFRDRYMMARQAFLWLEEQKTRVPPPSRA